MHRPRAAAHSPLPSTPSRAPRALRAAGRLALGALLASSAAAQFVTYSEAISLGNDDLAITPDGRYLVTRDASLVGTTTVVDLATGAVVFEREAVPPVTYGVGAPCVDAVEATNTRAVSLAMAVAVIDLTGPAPTLLAEHDLGETPRDVSITPDGRFALVRGGTPPEGGVHVIDLATGALVVDRVAGIQDYFLTGNDLCDADDAHGIALSYDLFSNSTQVHVVEFDGPGGGPSIVFESIGLPGLEGRPLDVAISPNGAWAGVRSETEMAIVRLDGVNSGYQRRENVFAAPIAPVGDILFDSVVMTDDALVTVSPASPLNSGGFVDVLGVGGERWSVVDRGLPHDIAVTPDQRFVLVNTDLSLDLIDLDARPVGGGVFAPADAAPFAASDRGLLAGLDSVVCTDDAVVAFDPLPGGTRGRAFALQRGAAPRMRLGLSTDLVGRPIDLAITPDGAFATWVTQSEVQVADLRTRTVRLREFPASGGGWPWGDGAAAHPLHLGVGGIALQNAPFGWALAIDLVSREREVCVPGPNGAGRTGRTFALGSTRVAEGDLMLHAVDVPAQEFGLFVYGDALVAPAPGSTFLCVGGQTDRTSVVSTGPTGAVELALDLGATPAPGAGFVAGSTWLFQFLHRDAAAPSGVSTASAVGLLLE